MMHIPDGRLVIVGAQREQVRSSRSRVRITLQELFLIWLGGRITSPRVWFGAGGQGVTLKLAWGPSISSPWNFHFVFAVFSIFFHNYNPFYLLISFFFLRLSFRPLLYFSNTVLVDVGFFSFFFSFFEIRYNIFVSLCWYKNYRLFIVYSFLQFSYLAYGKLFQGSFKSLLSSNYYFQHR